MARKEEQILTICGFTFSLFDVVGQPRVISDVHEHLTLVSKNLRVGRERWKKSYTGTHNTQISNHIFDTAKYNVEGFGRVWGSFDCDGHFCLVLEKVQTFTCIHVDASDAGGIRGVGGDFRCRTCAVVFLFPVTIYLVQIYVYLSFFSGTCMCAAGP